MLSVLFLLQSDTCLIDGQCYAANEAHPSASEVCLVCLPSVDDTDWTYGKHTPSLFSIPHYVTAFSKCSTDNYTVNSKDKKLSYRRVPARCVLSVVILPIATQQCRNYLYDKS